MDAFLLNDSLLPAPRGPVAGNGGHHALRGFPAPFGPGGAAGLASAAAQPPAGHFGDRLVAVMKWRGHFKATALACALGVNEAAISRWKRGGPITLTHAVRLCDTLDVSMDWLIRGLGDAQPRSAADPALVLPPVSARTVSELQALLQFIEQQSLR